MEDSSSHILVTHCAALNCYELKINQGDQSLISEVRTHFDIFLNQQLHCLKAAAYSRYSTEENITEENDLKNITSTFERDFKRLTR